MQPPVLLTFIHGPEILPHVSNNVEWMNIIPDIVDQSDIVKDLVLLINHCCLHFVVQILTYIENNLVNIHHTMDNGSV